MLCVTKAYALPDVDVIILDFFFKSATLELIEVLPAKEKTLVNGIIWVPCCLVAARARGVIQQFIDLGDLGAHMKRQICTTSLNFL